MTYTRKGLARLRREHVRISTGLQALLLQSVVQAQQIENDDVRKYLNHGVGRRLSILKKSMDEIFSIFPPNRNQKLERDDLTDVQIYLHAFVINVYGIFDNWAWAFVYRHGLSCEIGDRRNVGMFKRTTQRFLPPGLRDHLLSEDISNWYEHYLKNYRDALAHRIPLYIPPANWTDEDAANYQRLEAEEWRLLQERDLDRMEEVQAEQRQIGTPSFVFLHEYSAAENDRPLLLHAQVLTDSLTVLDFGGRFYREWHRRA